MLKKMVIIKDTVENFTNKEGIVVVVFQTAGQVEAVNMQCKVLVNNELSNWIPVKWLEVVCENKYLMTQASHSDPMREVV